MDGEGEAVEAKDGEDGVRRDHPAADAVLPDPADFAGPHLPGGHRGGFTTAFQPGGTPRRSQVMNAGRPVHGRPVKK
jgi:hypothetical protein